MQIIPNGLNSTSIIGIEGFVGFAMLRFDAKRKIKRCDLVVVSKLKHAFTKDHSARSYKNTGTGF